MAKTNAVGQCECIRLNQIPPYKACCSVLLFLYLPSSKFVFVEHCSLCFT